MSNRWNPRPLFPEDKNLTVESLKEYYAGLSLAELRECFKRDKRLRKFCRSKFYSNKAYESPFKWFHSCIKGIELRRCLTCGNFIPYSKVVKTTSDYCCKACWRKSEIYRGKRRPAALANSYNRLTERLHANGLEPLFTKEEYKGKACREKFKIHCLSCDETFSVLSTQLDKFLTCPKCHSSTNSQFEKEVIEYIATLDFTIVPNTKRILGDREIDIYIPNKKLGIECDGLYWHTEERGKDKFYHVSKTKDAESHGVRLIHIFEDEWRNKRSIVTAMLKDVLGRNEHVIDANLCTVKLVLTADAKKFLKRYHLEGPSPSYVRMGLYDGDRLIALMTFSKHEKTQSVPSEWILERYCHLPNFDIKDCWKVIMDEFFRRYKGDVYARLNRRWDNGKELASAGFSMKPPSHPEFFYTIDNKRYSQAFANKRLRRSSRAKMNRIWDCGGVCLSMRNNQRKRKNR
jgi:very-short-patch-repair endonuclease